MTNSYDLTFFVFLGGIVLEESGAHKHVSQAATKEIPVEPEYNLAPPRPVEEVESPGNKIIFDSLWTTQHRDNKRSSVKIVRGKVSDIRSKFEKSKRVVSGVFSAFSGRGEAAAAAPQSTAASQQRNKPKGPPPPQHVMTLAKGWNSGMEPAHHTKPVHVDY